MTLEGNYGLAHSGTMKARVASAIAKAAEDVRNESDSTTHHAERFTWATGILTSPTGPDIEADRAMWLVVQNATVQASGEETTDNDLQFTVNGLVNFLAGVDETTA